MMCWVALDRAVRLADAGLLHGDVGRWIRERAAIAAFVDSRCWSDAKRSYTRAAGSDELDAAVLLGALYGYRAPDDPRIVGTIDAVERELSVGPFVYRYAGEDGLSGREAAFLPCAFWLVEATARAGRPAAAAERMDALVEQANEVGLYAEELDPSTGAFLGNVPQALTHLALIGAALALDGGSA
jgi:GH15 family glucan-1,4-alpha-glucosidase